jgi:hypothetical protein
MREKMPKNTSITSKQKLTPGPKPVYLKIEGDWQEAVKKAIQKKKPAEGWP